MFHPTLKEFDESFPKNSHPHFMKIASSNWEALQKENFESDAVTPWLFKYLKPRRGHFDKMTVFFIFLLLCLKRPWENNWELSLSEKRGKDRSIVRIYEILNQINISYPDLTEGLNSRLKENDFQENIESSIYGLPLSSLERVVRAGLKPIVINAGIAFKLCDMISSKRFILKRDLQRKFWRNKKQLNTLLKNWEEVGDIKQKKFPGGSTWICLTEEEIKLNDL